MSIDDQLLSLSKNEATVLFYKCKGLKYNQIAARLGYSVDWVQLQMSTVYTKLGFTKDMHWTKRVEILGKEVCPKLPKELRDWKFEEPALEITEGSREQSKEEPKVDPKMMALVLYDEMAEEEEEQKDRDREPPIIDITHLHQLPPPSRNPFVIFLIRAAIFIVVVGFLSAIGYGAYVYGRNSITPITAVTQVITQVLPQPTTPPALAVMPTGVPSVAPANTLIPTSPPTDAPAPSPTIAFVPPPDGILFQDNFQNGLNPDWQQYSGNWIVSNGKLTLVYDQGTQYTDTYSWIGVENPNWKNYIVSLTIHIYQPTTESDEIALAVRDNTSGSKYIGFEMTCPPKADPLFELGLAKGDRSQCRENISR